MASQAHYSERFQLDHIIAQQHRGKTTVANLALCCMECNLRNILNVANIDPKTKHLVPLFNPRKHVWHDHFVKRGAEIVGRTDVGRATVSLLEMNRPPRVLVRRALIEEGVYAS